MCIPLQLRSSNYPEHYPQTPHSYSGLFCNRRYAVTRNHRHGATKPPGGSISDNGSPGDDRCRVSQKFNTRSVTILRVLSFAKSISKIRTSFFKVRESFSETRVAYGNMITRRIGYLLLVSIVADTGDWWVKLLNLNKTVVCQSVRLIITVSRESFTSF